MGSMRDFLVKIAIVHKYFSKIDQFLFNFLKEKISHEHKMF